MKSSSLTISRLAARCGVAPHVLRHWEDAGLLSPARERGQRRYAEADVHRVALIRMARDLGIGLGEIRDSLTALDAGDRTGALERQRAIAAEQLARARLRLTMIEQALNCPHPDYRTCPDLAELLDEWLRETTDQARLAEHRD
ncbi:MerR family transcriptional regulator [Cryptosporangium sp. NPDC051539]|uniref:MerR family transcriptional regulator n=1 Tax=Cryptosporangium sp. NPDC051539 TaxID=3363962 RepID=UPI0037A2D515